MAVEILLSLAVLIVSAKVFGEIAERLKIPHFAGEVFGGIVAGYLHLVSPSATLQEISNLGILFLLFMIGMGIRIEKSEIRAGSALAVSGSLMSFALGFLAGFYLFSSAAAGLVFGAALMSTSALASTRALMDFGEYKTKLYKTVSSLWTADGFMAILAISMLPLLLQAGAKPAGIAFMAFVLALLLLLALTVGANISNRFLSLFRAVKDEQIFAAVPLVMLFAAAFASEQIGLSLAGAFLAGIAISRSPFTESFITPRIRTIGYGFFVPLFFAYSALSFDIGALASVYWLVLLLVAAGFLGKLAGCGFLSAAFGFKWHERKIIGLATLPRGEYAIIVLQLAIGLSAISSAAYTALLAFVLVSAALTPFLLRAFGK